MNPNDGPSAAGPNSWLIDELFNQYRGDPRSVPEEWRAEFERREAAGRTAQAVPAATVDTPAPVMEPIPAPVPGDARPVAPTAPALPVSTGNGSSAPPGTPGPSPVVQASAPATPAPASPANPAPASPLTAEPAVRVPLTRAEPEGELLRGVAARIAANMEASLGVPTATSFRNVPAKLLEVNRLVLNNHLRRVRGGKVSFTHIIGFAVVKAISETVPNLNNNYHVGADGKPRLVRHPTVSGV